MSSITNTTSTFAPSKHKQEPLVTLNQHWNSDLIEPVAQKYVPFSHFKIQISKTVSLFKYHHCMLICWGWGKASEEGLHTPKELFMELHPKNSIYTYTCLKRWDSGLRYVKYLIPENLGKYIKYWWQKDRVVTASFLLLVITAHLVLHLHCIPIINTASTRQKQSQDCTQEYVIRDWCFPLQCSPVLLFFQIFLSRNAMP